jgi:hypothetical protein
MLELDRRLARLSSKSISEFKTQIHRECLAELKTTYVSNGTTTKPASLIYPLERNDRAGLIRDAEAAKRKIEIWTQVQQPKMNSESYFSKTTIKK